VVEFFVHRDDGDGIAEFDLDIGDWDKSYTFLVLMGHWNRTIYNSATPYTYNSVPPTLLAAGTVTTKPVPNLSITMGQVIVDTVVVKGATSENVNLNGNRVTTLSPGSWSVKWTLNPAIDGKTAAGYMNLLAAEGKNSSTSGINDISPALIKGQFDISTSLDEASIATPFAQWYLIKDLSSYTVIGNLGKVGYVNFNLNYVPFKGKSWSNSTVSTRLGTIDPQGKEGGLPLWIIRNGINDAKQDSNTNFAVSSWSGTGNGNGAVAFTVDAGVDASLAAYVSGRWLGPGSNVNTQKLEFTLKPGIGNGIEVYYAQGATTPTWESGAYIAHPLGTYNPGTHTSDNLALIGNEHVWLIVVKDGMRSNPVILDKSMILYPIFD
jgi:hypothetical protein